MLDVGAWIRAAHKAGIPLQRVARLAGVTRPTVYAQVRGGHDG